MEYQKTFTKKTFLVLVAGVAIGLMITSEKGSETLKKIANSLKSYGDDAKNKTEDLVDNGRSAFKNEENKLASSINS